MADTPQKVKRRPAKIDWPVLIGAVMYVLAFALVVGAAVYVLVSTTVSEDQQIMLLPPLAAAAGMLLALAPIALSLGAIRRLMRGERALLERRLDDLHREMMHVREEAALSDDARRVLNRSRERELLCRAIQEDIDSGDWDAGIVLANELAERFGYRGDAEQFRSSIEKARADTLKRQVDAAVALLDGMMIQRRWEAAMLEAGRIERLYPESPRAHGMRERVIEARSRYRDDLERRFLQAARDDDVDHAMKLLKELDAYLTPAEAEPYVELARGVIGKARENLGAQFKLAVQDRRWGDAAYYGTKIIEEFPNTRMAAEVRPVIDGIRERAAGLADARVPG